MNNKPFLNLMPPVIILSNPQLGENIGAAARAMKNCGFAELRLINPRDGVVQTKLQITIIQLQQKMTVHVS